MLSIVMSGTHSTRCITIESGNGEAKWDRTSETECKKRTILTLTNIIIINILMSYFNCHQYTFHHFILKWNDDALQHHVYLCVCMCSFLALYNNNMLSLVWVWAQLIAKREKKRETVNWGKEDEEKRDKLID